MQDPGVKTNRAWLADRVRQLLATVRSKHKGSWTSQRVSMPYLKQKVDPNGLCLGHISPRNKLPYTYYLIFSKRGKKKKQTICLLNKPPCLSRLQELDFVVFSVSKNRFLRFSAILLPSFYKLVA